MRGEITLEQFYAWCAMVFGNDDLEVEDGLRSWVCAARSSTELAGSRRVRAN